MDSRLLALPYMTIQYCSRSLNCSFSFLTKVWGSMKRNASVTYGNEFHACHADLLLFPKKVKVVSQPVKE